MDDEHRGEIAARYRRRADAFEATVAGTAAGDWSRPSPCAAWDARGVVRHVVEMHAVMLRPYGRRPAAVDVDRDPLGAFRTARAEVEAILDHPAPAGRETESPAGTMPVADMIDRVVSDDMVLHRWNLARASGQDDTIDPAELERMWPDLQQIPEILRVPGAFGPGITVLGPGITVFGPVVPLPADAPLQARALGLLGRDPAWTAGG